MPTHKVGFFHSGRKASFEEHYQAFRSSLLTFIPDADLKIIERWAGDDPQRALQLHAVEISNESDIDVIVAAGGPPSSKAIKEATQGKPIPVVFMSTADPVGLGLVLSLERPGTNMTGIAGLTSELDEARLELLTELLPNRGTARRIGVLNNGRRPMLEQQYYRLVVAASGLGVELVRRDAVNMDEIEAAFDSFKAPFVDAVLVTADSLFNNFRKDVVKLADGLRAVYQWREFVTAGGLMSFGPDVMEAYALVGTYTKRILIDEEKPENMPVASPTKFDLVINLTNAERHHFHIPASLLSRAQLVRRPLVP